ncbi:LysR family transcriptional regulator [Streptomyces sp. NPDC058642]|uniref:LysR family transcriptional regulator n=1 Tax=Streptomyces sp. NPDC058642 TaxID=3346572 RepID=UPI00364F31FA
MHGRGKDRYGIDSERIVINRRGGHVAPDTVSLRYFLVLAQELNFTRAAARIGIAQPALSARMRRLEAELGTALLVRNTRSVVLTTAGAALAESARPRWRRWTGPGTPPGARLPVNWARCASDTASAPGPRRYRPWWTG